MLGTESSGGARRRSLIPFESLFTISYLLVGLFKIIFAANIPNLKKG